MSALPKPYISVEEYLTLEATSEFRHEYIHGDVLAMTGGSRKRNRIAGNVLRALGESLDIQGCEVYINDVRVKIQDTGAYMYPDVVIVCGEEEVDDYRGEHLLNPIILIEVLSDSTESYDRGVKWAHYKRILSLQEYLVISQNNPYVEHYTRQEAHSWRYVTYEGLESVILLSSVGLELSLKALYRKVRFPLPPNSSEAQ